MAHAINIEELIRGRTVESERLEYKKGWNPQDVMHTICAFANDINNWGGGYVIIGVEEHKGQPVLPIAGLDPSSIDRIQGELIDVCKQIQPDYHPITQPYVIDGKHILVLYVPAGDVRPYSAPKGLGEKGMQNRFQYLRKGSRTVRASGDDIRRLISLAARVPFDDRIQRDASLQDLNLGLIRDFLQEIGSNLAEECLSMPFADLCRLMHIVKGPDEALMPVNAGLLLFHPNPHKFFDRAWIEVVLHKDENGTEFKEQIFKGPLQTQIRDTFRYINHMIITERIEKVDNQIGSDRYYNFPKKAVAEALSNAVYHKSYEMRSPIKVQIWPDKIEFLSFPGPVPPITADILSNKKRVVARDYRNRRLGDFLKELHLTEGRGTGIPKMVHAMRQNGSPDPVMETDDQNTYFLTVLPVHPGFLEERSDKGWGAGDHDRVYEPVSDGITVLHKGSSLKRESNLNGKSWFDDGMDPLENTLYGTDISVNTTRELLQFAVEPRSRDELLQKIGMENHIDHYKRYIVPLLEYRWLAMTNPAMPNSRDQKFVTTFSGKMMF